jgi:hypothetical protein
MEDESFKIEDREQAQKFQEYIQQYWSKNTGGAKLDWINIVTAFDKLTHKGDIGWRLFYMLLDIKINVVLLSVEDFQSSAVWNSCAKDASKDKNVLDEFDFFNSRMDLHKHFANYIPKYRALFDKIMGFLMLLESETSYNAYCNAKSRKKVFIALAKKINFIDDDFAQELYDRLLHFDNLFRTSELHQSGKIRKWTFLMKPFQETPIIHLRHSWNYLVGVLPQIDELIDGIN